MLKRMADGKFVAKVSSAASFCIMQTPPLYTTVRVNLLRLSLLEAKHRLQLLLDEQYSLKATAYNCAPTAEAHPELPDLLWVKGSGPHHAEILPCSKEVYVDRDVGASVMRGAHVYAPGVLGSSAYFGRDEPVAVYSDLASACLRGRMQPYDKQKLFLGNGLAMKDRSDIFKTSQELSNPIRGIGVMLTEPVWNMPALDTIVQDWGFVQNLPSVVCAHVLDPKPGDLILDMCAAPGGKSTHIAALMKKRGRVVCMDRGPGRAVKIMRNAVALGVEDCIELYPFYDATRAVDTKLPAGSSVKAPPFPPESFDKILLDPSCSNLGQRPQLSRPGSMPQIRSHETVQRRLLETAVRLLKPGGTLVYSTCTLRSEENEDQVRWLLSHFKTIRLEPQDVHLGKAPCIIDGLDLSKQKLLQKFQPTAFCSKGLHDNEHHTCFGNVLAYAEHSNANILQDGVNTDTIGFFIAKFIKAENVKSTVCQYLV